jgi:hypothetical protein
MGGPTEERPRNRARFITETGNSSAVRQRIAGELRVIQYPSIFQVRLILDGKNYGISVVFIA